MLGKWFAPSHQQKQTGTGQRSARLAVRGVVFDAAGRVFVVRHTHASGCYLPGGYVAAGESAMMALARELEEKNDILLACAPLLHGLFFDERMGEHIACYVVRDFSQSRPREPDWQTAKAGFFAIDCLPAEPSRATRARLDEVLHGASISLAW